MLSANKGVGPFINKIKKSPSSIHCLGYVNRELQISQRVRRRVRKRVYHVLDSISAILRLLNGCSVLAARKSLQSVTNELHELKL